MQEIPKIEVIHNTAIMDKYFIFDKWFFSAITEMSKIAEMDKNFIEFLVPPKMLGCVLMEGNTKGIPYIFTMVYDPFKEFGYATLYICYVVKE
jgi:hypothetical protein